MNKRRFLLVSLFVLTIGLLSSCTAGPNPMVNITASDGTIPGFWLGLWHGMITPFTFIISLFDGSVHIYAVNNNGAWYNFGYLMGLSAISGSTTKSTISFSRSK